MVFADATGAFELHDNLDALSRDAAKSQRQGPLNTMNSGQLVLVTLQNPREKFWGILTALTPAGASLRGVDLQSFDDFTQLVKAGEATTPNTVFFPMHRVQRMEVDARNGDLPSLADQFAAKTGFDVHKFFQDPL